MTTEKGSQFHLLKEKNKLVVRPVKTFKQFLNCHLKYGLVKLLPVLQITTKIVAEKRAHGKGVVHDTLRAVLSSSRCLGFERGAQEDSMLPTERLADERNSFGSSTSKKDCLNFDAFWVFPV